MSLEEGLEPVNGVGVLAGAVETERRLVVPHLLAVGRGGRARSRHRAGRGRRIRGRRRRPGRARSRSRGSRRSGSARRPCRRAIRCRRRACVSGALGGAELLELVLERLDLALQAVHLVAQRAHLGVEIGQAAAARRCGAARGGLRPLVGARASRVRSAAALLDLVDAPFQVLELRHGDAPGQREQRAGGDRAADRFRAQISGL